MHNFIHRGIRVEQMSMDKGQRFVVWFQYCLVIARVGNLCYNCGCSLSSSIYSIASKSIVVLFQNINPICLVKKIHCALFIPKYVFSSFDTHPAWQWQWMKICLLPQIFTVSAKQMQDINTSEKASNSNLPLIISMVKGAWSRSLWAPISVIRKKTFHFEGAENRKKGA